jgi:HK97 family phage prohead protease
MLKMVSPVQFRRAMLARRKAGTKTGPVLGVRKLALAAVDPSGDDGTLRFTITTSAVDRDQDTVNVSGWDFANYLKNPVVLWSHNAWVPPIGRAMDLTTEGDRVLSTVKFVPPELGDAGKFADTIYQLCKQGFLSAVSVGFRPIKWDFTDDDARGGDGWWPGIDFHEQELCEFSVCTVPSNPEALIERPESDAAGETGEDVTTGHDAQAAKDRRERRLRLALAGINLT